MDNNENLPEIKTCPQGSDFIKEAIRFYCKEKFGHNVVDIVEVGPPGLWGIKIHYIENTP